MRWERDGADWPHRAHSRFVTAGGLDWHVQRFESPGRPRCLLLHGTGASTHSWRGLAPLLQPHFELLAPDLPGHAFTGLPPGGVFSKRLSLPGMAEGLARLLEAEGFAPDLVVGHSAGAAVGARLCLDGLRPRLLASLNGALLPLGGLAGRLFSPAARALAVLPGAARLLSWRASQPRAFDSLLESTGSRLDATGQALYRRLVADADHVGGALAMMAHWDLDTLADALPALAVPLLLVAGGADGTVRPSEALRLQRRLPGVVMRRIELPGLGHLAHEEDPAAVADVLLQAWATVTA